MLSPTNTVADVWSIKQRFGFCGIPITGKSRSVGHRHDVKFLPSFYRESLIARHPCGQNPVSITFLISNQLYRFESMADMDSQTTGSSAADSSGLSPPATSSFVPRPRSSPPL